HDKVLAELELDRLPGCGEGYMTRWVGAAISEWHFLEERAVVCAAAIAEGFELRGEVARCDAVARAEREAPAEFVGGEKAQMFFQVACRDAVQFFARRQRQTRCDHRNGQPRSDHRGGQRAFQCVIRFHEISY